ncbi:hypothetical protein [Microbulbifer taiwanensis]|uniref:Transposase n=1 Tax=Microbulbifer taiwanensis TaxID=986746 RepID=A0ABW1YPQ4_9GAMM
MSNRKLCISASDGGELAVLLKKGSNFLPALYFARLQKLLDTAKGKESLSSRQ